MNQEKDYVLGTHNEELERLGLQHRVWRPRMLDAWRRAGFTVGKTILDVGCGPGFAAMDLAEIVGPTGRVIALDRSRRFLDALAARCDRDHLTQVDARLIDLEETEWNIQNVEGAWGRWVFCFLRRPREVLARLTASLRRGGVLVLHEYFDYATWRMAPRCPELEEFVGAVMQSWRAEGGEPDIALEIPRWLGELGFDIQSVKPIVDVVPPSSYVWQWPRSFLDVGLRRLVDIGRVPQQRAAEIRQAVAARESDAHTVMFTPAVLEIIAIKQ